MGTNYYLHVNICKHCNRYDEIHIGKSSCGWTFSFQGYEDETVGRSEKGEEIILNIMSYKGWVKFLEQEIKKGGKIFNEYKEEISFKDLKKMVKEKRKDKFNQTIYCREHHSEYARESCWLDDEGNSFSKGDFS